MSQPFHETTNMAGILGVETGTGAPPALRHYGGPISFTDTTSRSHTSVRAKPATASRISICRSLWTTLLDVLAAGWRRGQEDDRELERRRRRYSHLCESLFPHVVPLRTFTLRSKTGLFSAAAATLVAVSVQDLKPNPQDMSAFYLASIYQILADSNGSQVLIPLTLPNPSTPFSPPTSAIWVNSLWFLSLVISLTCALLATLLQQWARRYMKVIQTRYSPHKRARIRAFFAEGVEKLHLPWAVEALPGLLHLSLFLFFAGLAVFLFNINHTVFNVTISWVGFCTCMYMCITLMPMFWHDSPYYAPLSSSAWYLYTGILFTLFRILRRVADRCKLRYSIRRRARKLRWTYWKRTLRGMEKEFEETALKAPSEIDGRALMWTYESLDEDHELEQFFAGIPGFCSSNVVDDPQSSLDSLRSETVASALYGFLERTWSSNLVSETIKIRRLAICVRAIDAAYLSHASHIIIGGFLAHRPALFRSVELGHSLISWGNDDGRKPTLFTQGVIACVIANVPKRNDRWVLLTMHHLGISEHVLRSYLEHGESMLLANLIHFTRQFVRNFLNANREEFPLLYILRRLGSNYNIQDTLPSLQHDFCSLWNEVVLQRRDRHHHLLFDMLCYLLSIYVALHEDSTHSAATLDQLCSIPSHRMGSASHSHEADGNRTVETSPTPLNTSLALHHHVAIPSVIPPVTGYDAPPSPRSSMDHAIPHLVDPQSRNGVLDDITPVASSFHLAPLEISRNSDGTATDPIQGTTDPSAISSMVNTVSRSTPGRGLVSRPTRNVTADTPSFVPDFVPSSIPLLTVSPDPAAPHISVHPTVNQSARPPDGSISHSSSQISSHFPLAPQVISGVGSTAATEVGPLDAPDDTVDPNHRVMSQSFTQSSPGVAENSLRPGDGGPSEISGPYQ